MKQSFNSYCYSAPPWQEIAYVIAHLNDQAAFRASVDRFTTEAPAEVFEPVRNSADFTRVEALIHQKLNQSL